MKNYAGIISRLCGTPLLIHEDKLRILTEAITLPLMLGHASSIERVENGTNATVKEFAEHFSMSGRSIHIIPVFDSLVSKEISAGSGMTSYQSINNRIDSAIKNGATDIGFYIDSPGGEVSVFGLTEKVRSLPSRGIQTFCFCDMATSAAYAIAASTQHVYGTQVAQIGSIAAIAVHTEITKQAEKEGKTYTVFRSKEEKAIGDPYTALDETAIAKFTSLLETLDTEFNNDTVKSRPSLTLAAIIELKGKDLIGTAALTANLIDAVVPNLENALSLFLKDSKTITSTKPAGVTMSTPEELQTQLTEANQKIVALEAAAVTALEAQGLAVTAETERVAAVLNVAGTLKLDLATAAKYSDSKYSLEVATEVMTDLAEARDTAAGLDNSNPAPNAQENPAAGSTLRSSYKSATNL